MGDDSDDENHLRLLGDSDEELGESDLAILRNMVHFRKVVLRAWQGVAIVRSILQAWQGHVVGKKGKRYLFTSSQ